MSNTTGKPRIGFIGLGAMGSRMAARIEAAGYPLTVYNRSPEPARVFADRGATVAGSPRELAGKVDVVISSVFDDDSVAAILEGPDGVLAAGRPGLTVIEMSTLSPAASERFHVEAKTAGIDYLDCPVSGSTVPAEKGELVILVGGDAAVFERVRSILMTMGKAAELIGPGGAGSKAKLCINALVAVGVQALAESLAMGEAGGLDRSKLLDAIGQTAAVSPAQKMKFQNAKSGKYPPAFALKAVAKDLRLMADWAGMNGVKVPTIAATRAAADSAVPKRGAEDLSVLIDVARP
jgi:3-hydroxyisobutyrate dehydrogenase